MNPSAINPAESARLGALRRAGIFNTAPEADFDFLTMMAAEICHTPFAFITFLDETSVWAKSWHGVSNVSPRPRDDDYCDFVVRAGQPFAVPDLSQDERTARLTPTLEGYRMYAGVPLRTADDFTIGTLCVLDRAPQPLSPHQIDLLQALARQVMALVELRQNKRELEASLATLERLASVDELTGLMNRRRLMEKLGEECSRARRFKEPMAVVMLDLDHFKAINDEWGHAAGDQVLANTGKLIHDSLRETDSAGRYGGEELCLILPNTQLDGAAIVADNLRGRLALHAAERDGAPSYATASFGLAAATEPTDCHPAALLMRADAALYRAKAAGRNCIAQSEHNPGR